MTIDQILATCDLEKSVLIGYYGGGNYGDELLLEVLANRLKSEGVREATITYQDPSLYATYHHDFGYPRVRMGDKVRLLKTIFTHNNIIIGGGGLWGLDVNPNIVFLSLMLFISRRMLGKKVYLLGVGYYNSTNWYGRLSAWLAGKAATQIVARDQETFDNFRKITTQVGLDADIAWQVSKLDLQQYQDDFKQLDRSLPITSRTLFITLRRFKSSQKSRYTAAVEKYLAVGQHPVVLAIMEPRTVDPEGYELIRGWQKKYKQVYVVDFSWNPLALFLFFKKYRGNLALIAPQFHAIITAYLNGVPFLPIAYDNKVAELLKQVGQHNVLNPHTLTQRDIRGFVDSFYEGAR
ncbi:MAG TPA: polysaccharide pyruvyl transferase family protein [Candidatus Saccharimonadales bacterium]